MSRIQGQEVWGLGFRVSPDGKENSPAFGAQRLARIPLLLEGRSKRRGGSGFRVEG